LNASEVLVIGVGNSYRSDDGAGLEVARRLRESGAAAVLESEGEPIALLDAWEGAQGVVLIDAISSGATPGTIHRFDASREPLPASVRGSTSTHAVGLGEAIELARTLGRLPRRVIVYGIEGESFAAGEELSTAVATALDAAADRVIAEAHQLERGRPKA
jgi:hydrogenase maturation protease